jgi:hypothetical protein
MEVNIKGIQSQQPVIIKGKTPQETANQWKTFVKENPQKDYTVIYSEDNSPVARYNAALKFNIAIQESLTTSESSVLNHLKLIAPKGNPGLGLEYTSQANFSEQPSEGSLFTLGNGINNGSFSKVEMDAFTIKEMLNNFPSKGADIAGTGLTKNDLIIFALSGTVEDRKELVESLWYSVSSEFGVGSQIQKMENLHEAVQELVADPQIDNNTKKELLRISGATINLLDRQMIRATNNNEYEHNNKLKAARVRINSWLKETRLSF